MYKTSDIKIVGKTYETKDGKYKTRTTSPSWYLNEEKEKVLFHIGYAYWYEQDSRMGHTSYDFLFFNEKDGISRAVELLNQLLKDGCIDL